MAAFEPIRRTGQDVRGPDFRYPGLMVVDVTLSPSPSREWTALWNPYPPNSSFSISYGPPTVSGSTITLRVPDDKIKHAVEMLDGQIASANNWFEDEVLPRLQTAEDRARQVAEAESRRVDDARRQLGEIDRPDSSGS